MGSNTLSTVYPNIGPNYTTAKAHRRRTRNAKTPSRVSGVTQTFETSWSKCPAANENRANGLWNLY